MYYMYSTSRHKDLNMKKKQIKCLYKVINTIIIYGWILHLFFDEYKNFLIPKQLTS